MVSSERFLDSILPLQFAMLSTLLISENNEDWEGVLYSK